MLTKILLYGNIIPTEWEKTIPRVSIIERLCYMYVNGVPIGSSQGP